MAKMYPYISKLGFSILIPDGWDYIENVDKIEQIHVVFEKNPKMKTSTPNYITHGELGRGFPISISIKTSSIRFWCEIIRSDFFHIQEYFILFCIQQLY